VDMASPRFWLIAVIACALGGCNHRSATAPSTGYAGEWRGSTSQNQPIAFTVSVDQQVTSVTVGYSFGDCSGTGTSSAKSFPITNPQPPGMPPFDNPGFVYGGQPGNGSAWLVVGAFPSTEVAAGTVEFTGFPSCGNSFATWNAARQ
jgi:hypothetical protein